MSENSKIEWCDHTFNPWVGCSKVSPACDHCYAETWAKRTGQANLWAGDRRRTSPANWRQPMKWNAQHDQFYAEHGQRQRVFCASLADVFDKQVPAEWRADLWQLIRDTPNLDWLLLTKRPQNIARMLPVDWGEGWPNVWLGTTTGDQKEFDRNIGHLLNVPAAVHFISAEPLLGPIIIPDVFLKHLDWGEGPKLWPDGAGIINQIIVGGESGPGARPMHPEWARGLRDQCQASGTAFFFKQWGEWLPNAQEYGANPGNYDYEDRHVLVGDVAMARAGKKAAGRLLDGRTWDEFPEAGGTS